MDFIQTVTLFFQRDDAMQSYWTFYVTVVLGYIGFFGAASPSKYLRPLCVLATAAFCGFGIVNLAAIRETDAQRIELASTIRRFKPSSTLPAERLAAVQATLGQPSSLTVVTVFHLIGDLLVIGAIWAIVYAKQSDLEKAS